MPANDHSSHGSDDNNRSPVADAGSAAALAFHHVSPASAASTPLLPPPSASVSHHDVAHTTYLGGSHSNNSSAHNLAGSGYGGRSGNDDGAAFVSIVHETAVGGHKDDGLDSREDGSGGAVSSFESRRDSEAGHGSDDLPLVHDADDTPSGRLRGVVLNDIVYRSKDTIFSFQFYYIVAGDNAHYRRRTIKFYVLRSEGVDVMPSVSTG